MIQITIIIPVFNKEESLKNCLESVLNQVNENSHKYEVLLINDGSTDNSCGIIKNYANKNKCIRTVKQDNAGVSVARNKGLEIAQGEFVLFLDADDELVCGSLDKISKFLHKYPTTDILVTRQIKRERDNERLMSAPTIAECVKYTGIDAFKQKYVRTNAGGGICRTAFLRENNLMFPEGVKNAEDTIFFGLAQMYSKELYYLNVPLYIINTKEGSASRINETQLALRHIDTVNSIVNIRKQIACTHEDKGLIEYITYQLISNTIGHFIKSDTLNYRDLKEKLDLSSILPLETSHMHKMKRKAIILNHSLAFFYFLCWIKARL